jgi:hypothetical protein
MDLLAVFCHIRVQEDGIDLRESGIKSTIFRVFEAKNGLFLRFRGAGQGCNHTGNPPPATSINWVVFASATWGIAHIHSFPHNC